jgi:ankyrin repeat protein
MVASSKNESNSSKDSYGQISLPQAAGDGDKALMKPLPKNAAGLLSIDKDGWTLLWVATKEHEAVIHLLLENGAELESHDVNGRTCCHGLQEMDRKMWSSYFSRRVLTSYPRTLIVELHCHGQRGMAVKW